MTKEYPHNLKITFSKSAELTPSSPENDLEQIIYERIGWNPRLSMFQWTEILKIRAEFGDEIFYPALDTLKPGLKNIIGWLRKVCENKRNEMQRAAMYPKSKTEAQWKSYCGVVMTEKERLPHVRDCAVCREESRRVIAAASKEFRDNLNNPTETSKNELPF